MKFDSPLRYPGGKASLAELLAKTIELNGLTGCSYLEPFAGGAGAALRLLREGVVSEIHLNDLDTRIATFWNAVLSDPERFAETIMSVPVTIAEWRKQQEIYSLADLSKPFEVGFSAFYLNRCNRSGIISGAAPIGGYAQAGEWKIGARFYRKSLAERILAIGKLREHIHINSMDALDFLVECLPGGHDQEPVFIYLDPPYYSKGKRLYMSFYENQDHVKLARWIQSRDGIKWVMSYDDTDFIRNLYAACEISRFSLEYSLHRRRKAQELLISPTHVLLPASVKPVNPREQGAKASKEKEEQ